LYIRIIEKIFASFKLISPRTIGLYGLEILSTLTSVAWFNALDAAFKIAIEKLAGNIVVQNRLNKSSDILF